LRSQGCFRARPWRTSGMSGDDGVPEACPGTGSDQAGKASACAGCPNQVRFPLPVSLGAAAPLAEPRPAINELARNMLYKKTSWLSTSRFFPSCSRALVSFPRFSRALVLSSARARAPARSSLPPPSSLRSRTGPCPSPDLARCLLPSPREARSRMLLRPSPALQACSARGCSESGPRPGVLAPALAPPARVWLTCAARPRAPRPRPGRNCARRGRRRSRTRRWP
jgi:hypothetical protein